MTDSEFFIPPVIAVIGSRTKTKESQCLVNAMVETALRDIPKDYIIISGGCSSGADKAVIDLCEKQDRPYLDANAWWRRGFQYDRRAGIKRNLTIAQVCSSMIAVYDGHSPGTRSAMDFARKLGKPVKVLSFKQ